MTVVICDDDEKDVDRLKALIEKYDSTGGRMLMSYNGFAR